MHCQTRLFLFLFSITTFGQPDEANAAVDALQRMPKCGATCAMEYVSGSNCSANNITCLCTNESFKKSVQGCVESYCNVTDRLAVARVESEVCQLPRRSRRVDNYVALSVWCLGLVAVLLRLFSRWYLNTYYGVDDWIMVFTCMIYVAFQIVAYWSWETGFGVDTWYVGPEDLTFALKLFYIDETLYITLLALTKISILFLYLRIFGQPRFRVLCLVAMVWVLMSLVVFVLLQLFQCIPLSAIWESWTGSYGRPYRCLDVNALAYSLSGIYIAQDVVVLVLPLPLVLRLKMHRRRKASTIVMFSLGVFVLITSCVRLRFIVKFARSDNPMWDYADSLIWSGIEVAVSILVASLPAVRVLLVTLWPRMWRNVAGEAGRIGPSTLAAPKQTPKQTPSPPEP